MHHLKAAHRSAPPLQKAPGEPSLARAWEPQPLSGASTKAVELYKKIIQSRNVVSVGWITCWRTLALYPAFAGRQIPQIRWRQYPPMDSFLICFFLGSTASTIGHWPVGTAGKFLSPPVLHHKWEWSSGDLAPSERQSSHKFKPSVLLFTDFFTSWRSTQPCLNQHQNRHRQKTFLLRTGHRATAQRTGRSLDKPG